MSDSRRRAFSSTYRGGVQPTPSPYYGDNYIYAEFDIQEGEENTTMNIIGSRVSHITENNCTIYVDDVEIPFSKTYVFPTAGIHKVVYVFNTQMTSLWGMLSGCNIKNVDCNDFDATALTTTANMCMSCSRLYSFYALSWENSIGVDMSGMFGWTPFESIEIGTFSENGFKVTNLQNFASNNRNAELGRKKSIVDMSGCYGEVEKWDRCFRRQLGSSWMRYLDLGQIKLVGVKQEIFSWGERESLEYFRVGGLYKADITEFNGYNLLDVYSIMSIIDALPELVIDPLNGKEEYTLSLGNTMLAKLTDEQKSVATSKGWKLT